MSQKFRIAFFSDTHMREDLVFPDNVDLFIHCGDILEDGTFAELERAVNYFKSNLNGREMLFTPGNHDHVFETSRANEAIKLMKDAGIKYYADAGEVILKNGLELSVYFLPWIPEISSKHSFSINDEDRKKYIDKIPSNIDILVTHGPPENILDKGLAGMSFGDHLLANKLTLIRHNLKLHAFGHVHESRQIFKSGLGSPIFMNCTNAEKYHTHPWIVELPNLTVLC